MSETFLFLFSVGVYGANCDLSGTGQKHGEASNDSWDKILLILPPTTINYLAQNVTSTKAEKSCGISKELSMKV